MKSMHLLLIITDYGSFNNFLGELAISLVRDGHKVDVICSENKIINISDKAQYSEFGINLHFVEFPRTYNIFQQLCASYRIHQLIQIIQPEIIHAHFTTGIFTTVLYRKPKQITIGTIHGLGYPMMSGLKRKIFKLVEQFCINRTDKMLVLNSFDYNLLYSSHRKKVTILDTIGLGCDLSRFNIDRFEPDMSSVKAQLGIENSDFVIAFTGRFVQFKGFDLVINSFLSLNEQFPSSFKLLLIGGEDPIHKTGLNERQYDAYKSCKNIISVGFTNKVETYLAVSNVFLFPSLKEGMPVCVIESLAMGVPVIASDSRGCNDLVDDGKNGLLLSKSPTIDEIVKLLLKLNKSPEILSSYRVYALKMRNQLDRNIYIKQQTQLYKALL